MDLVSRAEVPVSLIVVETNGPRQLGSIGQVPFGNDSLPDPVYFLAAQDRLWNR